MHSRVFSSILLGIEAHPVEVEVDLAQGGLPCFSVVGLPDMAVKESRDRIRTAINNTGYDFPVRKIIVNLAPADIKKEGTSFDLPIAVAILVAAGYIPSDAVERFLIVGELALDGRIRGIPGILSMAIAAKQTGLTGMIVPAENADEAAIVSGIDVYPVESLPQLTSYLTGHAFLSPRRVPIETLWQRIDETADDFSEVRGQEHAKRALEVAAAGGHNLLMIGPPGSGKTMLARRLPGILPALSLDEAIETTRVHSLVRSLPACRPLLVARPFRHPHHSTSEAGLIGGGTIPRPGEVSLAHNGVLFLDELPEFRRNTLEVLRQPLEDGTITVARVAATLTYPARFILIGAMNPCPCGHLSDPSHPCTCTPVQIQRYRSRISGPLMDRIDIQVEVPAIPVKDLVQECPSDSSLVIRGRVDEARRAQQTRLTSEGLFCNAQMKNRHIKIHCSLQKEAKTLLDTALDRLRFSGRAYYRILKVARTIADLGHHEDILASDVAEAIQYRLLDRPEVYST